MPDLFPLLLLVFMTLLAAPADAANRGPLILSGPADIDMLAHHFDYVLDRDWALRVDDFAGPSSVAMQPLPGPVPDFGYTPARIWLRLDVSNGTGGTNDWLFFVHANFTQQIAIYRIGVGGDVATLLDLDTQSPFGARPVDYPQMVAPFALAPGEAATLLVAYYSQGASRLSMSVETPESFAVQARLNAAKNYVFYGMMGILIAAAVLALVMFRQMVFAAYAAYLFSVFLYVAHADGTTFQYIWPHWPAFNSMASVAVGSGVMVFGGLFAIAILQTSIHHPIMHRVLLAVVASVVVLDIVLWAIDPQLLKQLLVIMISITTMTLLVAGLVAARRRFREVRFYVLGWLATVIPSTLFTARHTFGIETERFNLYDAVRVALVFEAMMMGLAIVDRFNQLRQSRRQALEESLGQARRNLALGERLALLEERYALAQALERRRAENAMDTAHDLRQPMHALRLSIRQMFTDRAANADAAQIESALDYMERLVAERLVDDGDAGGADRPSPLGGEAEPAAQAHGKEPGEPGIHDVLRGIADMFAPEAQAKGLELRLVLAAPDAGVASYPLMRIAANLVSNAIKYTRQGRVVIGLRRHGTGHRVEIHDTGPGLSGTVFEEALHRGHRLERDRSAAEGSGLGLAVVRETAAANGWRVTACEGRRTGATIRIELAGASVHVPELQSLVPETSVQKTALASIGSVAATGAPQSAVRPTA
ncbi:sensor histidine kinase [Aquibium sp. ELW1220]|uniref:sensor histidine kinase n=1 Tax=Aquibium sp. ELW1220 TaxID=2976766 RepID=UPI0025B0F780|nr:sensor histidine kinase [Aquibium sp. ELW1220]MDN2583876.1 sensor histidine kinase [Aquibium sp. ELW1220]